MARGEADAICVDCVDITLLPPAPPEFGSSTRVLAVTPPSPSIPFVTSSRTPEPLRRMLGDALFAVARSEEWSGARAGLMLRDIVPVEPASYEVQLRYEQEAKSLGYPELA